MFRSLIAVAIVALAVFAAGGADSVSAGGGCHEGEVLNNFTDASGTSVSIERCAYQPTVVRVAAGDEVTFTNADGVPHTVTGAAGSWGNDNALGQGESVTEVFETEGVFPYYCAFHPTMVGAVIVGDGEANGAVTAAAATGPGGGGISAASIAAIVGAVAVGGAAVGMVGRRMMSARREGGAAA